MGCGQSLVRVITVVSVECLPIGRSEPELEQQNKDVKTKMYAYRLKTAREAQVSMFLNISANLNGFSLIESHQGFRRLG